MQVKLLFFAKSREISGVSQRSIVFPTPVTGNQLLERIVAIYPEFVIPVHDSLHMFKLGDCFLPAWQLLLTV